MLLLLPVFAAMACASTPDRNRLAGVAYDEAFRQAAAARYRQILAPLARGQLDDDALLLRRARRIAPGLIAAATTLRPEVEGWPWEIHVSGDPSTGTFCMAGGKLLIAGDLVRRLDLDDGELATLIGHEMAHAVAGHRREVDRSMIDADVTNEVREAQLALTQEIEADRIGMSLARRAGWPASSIVHFYEKLAAEEPPGTFSSSHPSAALRVEVARRAMAADPGR